MGGGGREPCKAHPLFGHNSNRFHDFFGAFFFLEISPRTQSLPPSTMDNVYIPIISSMAIIGIPLLQRRVIVAAPHLPTGHILAHHTIEHIWLLLNKIVLCFPFVCRFFFSLLLLISFHFIRFYSIFSHLIRWISSLNFVCLNVSLCLGLLLIVLRQRGLYSDLNWVSIFFIIYFVVGSITQ